jgi:ribosomal subunit interface protein
MDLEIDAKNVEIHPRWRELIERRVARLDGLGATFIRLHVTLNHSTHHMRGDDEVRVLGSLPGRTLHVSKTKPDMGMAIHSAFDALEREIETCQPRG